MDDKPLARIPEITLWTEVLSRAVKDIEMLTQAVRRKPAVANHPLFKNDVRGLYRYFRSQTTEPGGFIFICLHLGQNPSYALNKIEAFYLEPLADAIEKSRLKRGARNGRIH